MRLRLRFCVRNGRGTRRARSGRCRAAVAAGYDAQLGDPPTGELARGERRALPTNAAVTSQQGAACMHPALQGRPHADAKHQGSASPCQAEAPDVVALHSEPCAVDSVV